jgi:hypothetical protein
MSLEGRSLEELLALQALVAGKIAKMTNSCKEEEEEQTEDRGNEANEYEGGNEGNDEGNEYEGVNEGNEYEHNEYPNNSGTEDEESLTTALLSLAALSGIPDGAPIISQNLYNTLEA